MSAPRLSQNADTYDHLKRIVIAIKQPFIQAYVILEHSLFYNFRIQTLDYIFSELNKK